MFTQRHVVVSTNPRRVFVRRCCNRWGIVSIGALGTALLVLSCGVQAQKPPARKKPKPSTATPKQNPGVGRALFVKNCSPCHGASGQGGEGPNLQKLALPEAAISATIKTGVKGEMPAFGSKFQPADLKALTAFVRSLRASR